MAALHRRRLRLPVLSRLTLAWSALALVAAGFAAASYWKGDRPLIELALDRKIETTARPLPAREPRAADKPATPAVALRDDASPAGTDVYAGLDGDALALPDAGEEMLPDDAVVITIDGEPARDARLPAPPVLAAVEPPKAIPGPDPQLLAKTPFGMRPAIGRDGRRAETAYAHPFTEDDRPKVALIVGGLGLNRELTLQAIEALPAEVTLAFAPYARGLEEWSEKARADGHEVMIELPMEARGPEGRSGEILGPAALLTGREPGDNLQRLDWLLSRLPAAFGATNYLGTKFSADDEAMRVVLARLAQAGLAYADDTGSVSSAPRARLIDSASTSELAALEATASQTGRALGKAYLDPGAIDAIARWTEGLEEKGYALAPASAVISRGKNSI
jgi:hypothetical protein